MLDKLERYEEAIASYDQAIAIQPNDYAAWNNRGFALFNLERYEEAIANFDRAVDIQPDFHEAWNNWGIALGKLEHYEEAIASFNRAVDIQPDCYAAWYNRGNALDGLERYEEAIASYDQALAHKPNMHHAWYSRSISAYNSNAINKQLVAFTMPPQLQNPALDQRGYLGQLVSLREGFKYIHQDTYPEGWGSLHYWLGDAHYNYSNYQEKPRSYWRKSLRSYHTALQTLTAEVFPEPHLEVLQGLIRTYLALNEIPTAQGYQQQGSRLFEQLRAAKPDHLKPAFESKFASFSQLEIDLLIGEKKPIAALEQAEFYKNRCLTWILDAWQPQPASADYAQAQTLLNPQTAILYWHLSPDALTTFILTTDRDRPLLLDCDRRQQAQQFEEWRNAWDRQYRDYASQKKEAGDRASHPWRKSLEHNWQNFVTSCTSTHCVSNCPLPLTP